MLPVMDDYRAVIMLFFVGYVLVELAHGRFWFREKTTAKDLILDFGSVFGLAIVVLPTILWTTAWTTEAVVPGSQGALAHWPVWLMFVVLVIADDLVQYWWHRLSHNCPRLFLLHRAHHSAEYLSVRLVYRNNIIYYALMPGLWFSGVLLYLGFAPAYYIYYIAKMVVIISAHSSVRWDAKLLQIPWLRPFMWVLVRVISTPSTHSAHHGKYTHDRHTHYKGNYGNFLFLWDVVFGTAKITGGRPRQFGIENVAPATIWQELVWPFRTRAR